MGMKWKDLKQEVDRQLKELGIDDGEIDYIDLSLFDSPKLKVEIIDSVLYIDEKF